MSAGAQTQAESSNLFIKVAISELMHPKDGHRPADDFQNACSNAIEKLEQAERDMNYYESVFKPFMLACSGSHNPSILLSLDCLGKLFGYKFWNNTIRNAGQDAEGLVGLIIETVSSCFSGEQSDEKIQMQVIKVMAAAICVEEDRAALHGTLLLKAVRIIYNIFLLSQSAHVQTIAQATLIQTTNTVFNRIPKGFNFPEIMKTHKEKLNQKGATNSMKRYLNEDATKQQMFLNFTRNDQMSDLQDPFGVGDVLERDRYARPSQDILTDKTDIRDESINDQITKDAYLIFRAYSKLSMKPLAGAESATELKAPAMRSKLLSLHLIHMILKDYSHVFYYPSPALFTTDVSAATAIDVAFIHSVRQYICTVITRNVVSIVPQVFDISMNIFGQMLLDLRFALKKEVSVMFTKIVIPMIEATIPTTYYQRIAVSRSLLNSFSTSDGAKALVELYLNYDCDVTSSSEENIFERLIISICHVLTNTSTELFEPHQFDFSIPKNKFPQVTISTLANYTRDQVRQLYLPTADTTELKLKLLDLLVRGMLQSLSSWGTTARDFSAPSIGRSDSEMDDPSSFEHLKNKKARLAEGIKLFNRNPDKAIKRLIQGKIIPSNAPRHVAHFLYNCPGLDKTKKGEYMGEGTTNNIAVMHCFVDYMDLSSKSFVEALRSFLSMFRLPGEAQKIDRFMLKFAERYLKDNPRSFSSADTPYILAYSVIMLNTDLHNPRVKNRMTLEQFIKNNHGIDEGSKNLDAHFLEEIYKEIEREEIAMIQPNSNTSVYEEDFDQVNSPKIRSHGPIRYFKNSSIDANIRKHHGSIIDPTTLDVLFEQKGTLIFIEAHNSKHVKPMFLLVWMSVLMSLTSFFQNHNEVEGILNVLDGVKHCIRICCAFDLELQMDALFSNLSKFVELGSLLEIKDKNIEASKTLMEIALENGNGLDQNAWSVVVRCLSQLEYHQSTGVVEAPSNKSADQKKKELKSMEETYYRLTSQAVTLSVDRIFTASVRLQANSIYCFVRALCVKSWDEIISSSNKEQPRMYSLQRLLEIAHYNLSTRIRIEWNQIWDTVGPHFNQIGCHSNANVVYFCLDKYRQLATKFLEIEELENFKFQKAFLSPFHFIYKNNPSPKIKDMVLSCVNHMILYKAVKLRSGWIAIFEVLSAAATEKTESVVELGLKLTSTINSEFADFVIAQNSYGELVATITKYCNITRFPKISSQAVTILKYGAEKFSLQGGGEEAGSNVSPSDSKIWLVTLNNMKEVIITCDMEVRNRALSDLFELLVNNGGRFANPLWMVVMEEIVLPLFAIIKRSPDGNSARGKEDAWIATTMSSALEHVVKLYSTFPVLLKIALDPILDLFSFCILQENESLAKLGSSCLQMFIEDNCEVFENEMWDSVCKTFKDLFAVTLPVELFCEIDDDMKKPKVNGTFQIYPKPSKKQYSKIIIKCILHLAIIRMMNNLIVGPKSSLMLGKLHQRHIVDLSDTLYKSYLFAQAFNENLALRQFLLKIGFMKTLPNLVKQETTSAATYLILLADVYKDVTEQRQKTVREIEGHLFSLAYSILQMFCKLDPETQQGNVIAWEPVITVIVEAFADFPEAKIRIIHPYFYDLFVKVLGMKVTQSMSALSVFFDKVGKIHSISKVSPPFVNEKFKSEALRAVTDGDEVISETDEVTTGTEELVEQLAEQVVNSSLRQSVEFLTGESTFIDPF